jgi:methionyl-tRNA formyltransferase
VWRTAVADEPWVDGVPGEVVEVSDEHTVVVTGDGCLALLDLDRPAMLDLRVGDVLR